MSQFPNDEELRAMVERGDTDAVNEALRDAHPHRAAEGLEVLEDDVVWAILREARPEVAAAAFSHLPIERQARLAESHPPEGVARLLAELPPDDRADLIKNLDDPVRERLLALLPASDRSETERLARHPEGTVGSVMSTEFAAIPRDLTVAEALDLIRLEAPNKETIYSIYVMDDDARLVGTISLRDLILASPQEKVAELMEPNVISATVDEPREAAADKVKSYDLLALPVVGTNRQLVGIVTVDDVLDVEEAEATEDFHKLGATGLKGVGLRDAGITLLYRARVPWLLALVFINVFSGEGIAYFEDTIVAVASLVFFLPLLIDSGGNAGSQAATLMVRALAVGDVRMRDWFHLIRKELAISLLLGLTMAVGVMLIASYRSPDILVPVGLTMVCTVLFGSLVGMSLPFLLTRLKLDPATASAPLITSIADIGGVLIYFSIATWWLGDVIRAAVEANGG